MYGDDYSLASVDANPTFDQLDDGGSSSDFSSAVSAAGSLGMELASAVGGFTSQPSQTPVYSSSGGPAPLVIPGAAKNNNAAMLLVGVVAIVVIYMVWNS